MYSYFVCVTACFLKVISKYELGIDGKLIEIMKTVGSGNMQLLSDNLFSKAQFAILWWTVVVGSFF